MLCQLLDQLIDVTKTRFTQHDLMMKLMLAAARWKIATT